MAAEFKNVIPTFRIFSLDKTREFYIDFLGCKIDWDHRFDPDAPIYMQVSRGGLTLHLSEHHGDGTPGSLVYVIMSGIKDLHRELNDKNYRHYHPGLEQMPWKMLQMTVIDPFGNRICFAEPNDAPAA